MFGRTVHIVLSVSVSLLFSCANNRLEKPSSDSTLDNVSSANCSEKLPDTVSFDKQIIPILAQNCALPSCHSTNRPNGNLNLETSVAYNQITRPSRGYLDLIIPTNSVLYNSLTSSANLMPPTGRMNQCNIDLIMKWMGQGAKNN